MTITQVDSGTTLADGTEQTLDEITSSGAYGFTIDLTNMASGDTTVLRAYEKVLTGSSYALLDVYTFTGAQTEDVFKFDPYDIAHSIKWTLEQTAGTNRNYDWSSRSVT